MAEQESTTDSEHVSASATSSKDSNSIFEQPSIREEIDRERDRLVKVFGICKTLQHALMYSDGDMDKNAECYSDAADVAADIIDSVHAELDRIVNKIKMAEASQEDNEEEDDEDGDREFG